MNPRKFFRPRDRREAFANVYPLSQWMGRGKRSRKLPIPKGATWAGWFRGRNDR